jgi:hypothetical protein
MERTAKIQYMGPGYSYCYSSRFDVKLEGRSSWMLEMGYGNTRNDQKDYIIKKLNIYNFST